MKPGRGVGREEPVLDASDLKEVYWSVAAPQQFLSPLTTSLSPALVLDLRPLAFSGVKTSSSMTHLELNQHFENSHCSCNIFLWIFLCPCPAQNTRWPVFHCLPVHQAVCVKWTHLPCSACRNDISSDSFVPMLPPPGCCL